MELEKIVRVEDVGRFRKPVPSGDVTFRRLTLLFGPNGHGKTTLAGILRSLQTGDPAYIMERATLGKSPAKPHVELRLSSGKATYDGSWSITVPDLEIFDTTFVNDNVYTGDYVDSHHRKKLYEVIVGDAAVKLAREIDRLDTVVRTATREITELEIQLREHIQAPFTLDEFLELQRSSLAHR
jgi:wobble nucleotide-excising tRNase